MSARPSDRPETHMEHARISVCNAALVHSDFSAFPLMIFCVPYKEGCIGNTGFDHLCPELAKTPSTKLTFYDRGTESSLVLRLSEYHSEEYRCSLQTIVTVAGERPLRLCRCSLPRDRDFGNLWGLPQGGLIILQQRRDCGSTAPPL